MSQDGRCVVIFVLLHRSQPLFVVAPWALRSEILEEKAKSKAILLVSSDLLELLKLSDRIGVMYNGELVTIMQTEKTNEREIGLFMLGARKT